MQRAIVVTDLGYGDAGKGSMVDYLAQDATRPLVIRHNGGPQAAHNVITADGRHHTFAQFGSASFVTGARTHLSRFMLVNPFNLMAEAEHLVELGEADILERLTIDQNALVITPWHVAANRIRELVRGGGRHGSCGQGIGETKFDFIHFPAEALRVRDLGSPEIVRQKLTWVQNIKQIQLAEIIPELPQVPQSQKELEVLKSTELIEICTTFYEQFVHEVAVVKGSELERLMDRADLTLFEGAQAVLLDQDYGFHPYTTWSVTTQQDALTLLAETGFKGEVIRLGVIRAYMVRHGAGPFVSENDLLTRQIPDYHNGQNDWQQGFRVGHLDFVALRYALAANGPVDSLAVTNLDRLQEVEDWATVDAYQLPDRHQHSPYFTGLSEGKATGIRVGPKNRRDYQETITNVLLDTKPILDQAQTGDVQGYLARIKKALGTTVSHLSFGPTAEDKHQLVP